jgi:hypothetical protein
MTAKELSRAINGLQNMGGGRMSSPSPLQQVVQCWAVLLYLYLLLFVCLWHTNIAILLLMPLARLHFCVGLDFVTSWL